MQDKFNSVSCFQRLKLSPFLLLLILLNNSLISGEVVKENGSVDNFQPLKPELPPPNNDSNQSGLSGFEECDINDCNSICGSKDPQRSFCEPTNSKLCMCAVDNYIHSNVEGQVVPVNPEHSEEKACVYACNSRKSYSRIWHRNHYAKSCTCLMNQVTKNGFTNCDEFAIKDWCKIICNTESARCIFNGACLCGETWGKAFRMEIQHVRKEEEHDKKDCSTRCRQYNTEYAYRVYDTKGNEPDGSVYGFRQKFCMCGEELEAEDTAMMKKLNEQGFQACTGLKCKSRCGMNMDAECEPKYRRSCLCPRHNIFIGKYLWARLPSRQETICVESCIKAGLAPRVIEWNPFYDPRNDWSNGVYRTSRFPYLYDGKFCHCINLKNEPDVNQFRPCTNELCRWLCGHVGATCDAKTRRFCNCHTHQLIAGLGRRPDPGEINCNVMCRRNLDDARIIHLNWDIPAPHWSVTKAKFCGCVRPVTPSGLTHCEGLEGHDLCPKLCNTTAAYCTRDKVCECHIQSNPLSNPMVRLPDGKESVECNEVCRSWIWPLTEDINHVGYIYDESRQVCAFNNTCKEVDTKEWSLDQPGALSASIDALEQRRDGFRRFCLCVRNDTVSNKPGVRLPFTMEPPRLPKTMPCILNYTCLAVGENLHIVG